MNKTGIEYCDMTFNPVTGCLRGCSYCYARGIARRFEGYSKELASEYQTPIRVYASNAVICSLDYPLLKHTSKGEVKAPYPFGFDPTFHRYRLGEPAKVKKPQTIFVGSMTDLFHDAIPDKWIEAVFEACKAAPWHRYLFLTKNPKRYTRMGWELPRGKNYWYGATVTRDGETSWYSMLHNTYISVEPLLDRVIVASRSAIAPNWVIVGKMTGAGSDKHEPKREWIEQMEFHCRTMGVPLFMKNSLRRLMGDAFVQEKPWGVGVRDSEKAIKNEHCASTVQ